jgi:hypothetical protein
MDHDLQIWAAATASRTQADNKQFTSSSKQQTQPLRCQKEGYEETQTTQSNRHSSNSHASVTHAAFQGASGGELRARPSHGRHVAPWPHLRLSREAGDADGARLAAAAAVLANLVLRARQVVCCPHNSSIPGKPANESQQMQAVCKLFAGFSVVLCSASHGSIQHVCLPSV